MAQTTRRRRKKRKKGRGKLIFLLVLLVGVSTWNYQRNVAIEEAKPRPYRSYSDAELEQLADVKPWAVCEVELGR